MGLGTQGLPSGVSGRRHRFPGVISIVEGDVMLSPQGRPGDTTGALGSSMLSKKSWGWYPQQCPPPLTPGSLPVR